MNTRKPARGLALATFAAWTQLALGVPAAQAKAPDANAGSVTVTQARQAASGIETRPLARTSYVRTLVAYGEVVDVRPLIDLAARLATAQAQRAAAAAAATAARQEYDRLELLSGQGGNVALREVQAAHASLAAAQARLQGADQSLRAALESARAEWGATLADWARHRSAQFRALASGREALLQLVPAAGLHGRAAPAVARLVPPDGTEDRIDARLVSPSPRSDREVQGETYFYRAPRGDLRTGLHVMAELSLPGHRARGVLIPQTAVIWYAGRAWAYVRTGSERFARRKVSTDRPVPGGWFAANGWRAGEQVVVRGAQLLYSEESRPRGAAQAGAADDD